MFNLSLHSLVTIVKALLSREASMPSDYYCKEKCITWKNSIVGFAIWFFLITAMFLLDFIALLHGGNQ